MSEFPNDKKPDHLIKLSKDHTKPIRHLLDSFEGAIWLAYLRGEQSSEKSVELKAENEKLRSALRFYADESNYEFQVKDKNEYCGLMSNKTAKEALKKEK